MYTGNTLKWTISILSYIILHYHHSLISHETKNQPQRNTAKIILQLDLNFMYAKE
jgi:hypothetical protein